MALLEITEVVQAPPGPALRAWYLDSPVPGNRLERTTFELSGWLVGARSPAREVQLREKDVLLRTIPVNVPRPDVVSVHEGAPEQCGFWSLAGTLGVAPEFRLDLRAVFEDGSTTELGSIGGTRSPIASGESRLNPLLVTSLGRTGTTLLMGLLAGHPAIVAEQTFPYEVFPARYWLQMARVLSEPADHSSSSHPSTFTRDFRRIGHNPFHTSPVTNRAELADFLGSEYVQRLARFCKKSIDDFYEIVAEVEGKDGARFFLEKFQPDHLPRVAWELFPETKEIILVRDFRDLICSVFAFNEKRQTVDFGREKVDTDEEYVSYTGWAARLLLDAWTSRRGAAELVRYEDLAVKPAETVGRLLSYLGLDGGPEVVDEMLRAAFDHPAAEGHRTTPTIEASIGRWRRELPRGLRSAVRRELDGPLAEFGYELRG